MRDGRLRRFRTWPRRSSRTTEVELASPSSQRAPGGGSTSTSWQLTPTPILTVADLAALPRDRIIVMPSGAPPMLAEPVYWWNTRQAAQIRESIQTHDLLAILARRHTPQPLQETASALV